MTYKSLSAKSLTSNYNKFILGNVAHEVLPGFNTSLIAGELDDYGTPDWKCSLQYPVYVSADEETPVLDICKRRVKEYHDYNMLLGKYRSLYKTNKKNKNYKKGPKKSIYPFLVLKYAEMLASNPNPYFSGRYDWCYTGGNLAVLGEHENEFVAHAKGSNLQNLVLSTFSTDSKFPNLETIALYDPQPKGGEEIFEIRSLENVKSLSFSVRRNSSLSILRYKNDKLKCEYTISNENVPLISSAEGTRLHQFVTSDLGQTVKLWDLKKDNKEQIQILHSSTDHAKDRGWNRVMFYDRNVYLFADFKGFSFLDTRKEATNESFFKFGNGFEFCEDIVSMAMSEFDNLLYFGTTHKLFSVDVRNLEKSSESEKFVVQRWTHFMDASPLMLDTLKEDDQEYVLLSSSRPGDNVIIQNKQKITEGESRFFSKSMPYMPPNVTESLSEVQKRSFCLNPRTNWDNRLKSCQTGSKILVRGKRKTILTANSMGDIFAQHLVEEEKEVMLNKNLHSKWETACNEILEQQKNVGDPLYLTAIGDLKGLNKILRCKELNQDKLTEADDEPKQPRRRAAWQKSYSALQSYKDALAADMLAIWDVEEDETRADTSLVCQNTKLTGVELVSNWLTHSSNSLDDTAMVSIPRNLVETTFVEENTTNLNESIEMDTILNLQTPKPSEKRKTPMRKKHVKGF